MVVQVADKKDLTVKLQEAGNKLVVIDFYATWCGPCKIIAPKIEDLEKELTNVVFLKIDVDENEDIAQEYDITAMPTFVFIKQGNKVDAFSGANFDKLKTTCQQHNDEFFLGDTQYDSPGNTSLEGDIKAFEKPRSRPNSPNNDKIPVKVEESVEEKETKPILI